MCIFNNKIFYIHLLIFKRKIEALHLIIKSGPINQKKNTNIINGIESIT